MRKAIKIITNTLHSCYIDIPALRPGTVGAYALAVVSVGIATALRVALDPYLDGAQFVTFFPAIAITTLISGFGAGFLCAVLSTAAADFFVLTPRVTFYVPWGDAAFASGSKSFPTGGLTARQMEWTEQRECLTNERR